MRVIAVVVDVVAAVVAVVVTTVVAVVIVVAIIANVVVFVCRSLHRCNPLYSGLLLNSGNRLDLS